MRNGGVIAVVVPCSQGEWKELLGRTEIKREFLGENKSCFHLAGRLPFMVAQNLVNIRGTVHLNIVLGLKKINSIAMFN